MSNARAASMPRTISATAITGRSSGMMMRNSSVGNRAPSSRAASMTSPGTFCSPAKSTSVMNDVVSQTSGSATENRAIFGSLSQPIWSVLCRSDRRSSSLMMPKLSMSRNRQSRPATTGAIMSGYMNTVRNTADRLPSAAKTSATPSPMVNSSATTMTV